MKLHTLKPAKGATKKRKRIGRGQGSGRGGTSTRGHKGAQSRSGYTYRPWFEGGQMPLQRRVPKFGFKNRNRVEYKAINLDVLQEFADKHKVKVVDHQFLVAHGWITNTSKRVKVLGRGKLSTALEVKVNKFSKSAKEAIEVAGGQAIEAGNPKPKESDEKHHTDHREHPQD